VPGRLLIVAIAVCGLWFAACGDGPAAATTPTPAGSPTARPTASGFGPAPVLGDNVLSITPAHAAIVTQASTRTTNLNRPGGLCADVSFQGLPQSGQWFRLVFDAAEVTASKDFVWILPSKQNPDKGRFCYAPPAGFSVGKHTAAIGVQDPSNPNAPLKQTVAWSFEVSQ
jgi:hypothetical protein